MVKKVLIVGAGAAGMMAAIAAAEDGAQVTLIEHNDRVGRKILSTGNGRCNYTNLFQEPSCYRSDEDGFPWKVISGYPAEWVLDKFEEMGVMPKEKNGYIYPFSEQASAVLDVLRMEIDRLKIQLNTSVHVTEVLKKKKGFLIKASKDGKSETFAGDSVVLACGSKAASKLGSDGSGYDLAKKLGHKMVPVVPALVQLKCKESFYQSLAGIRVQGKVTLMTDGNPAGEDTGEIQLTAYGISGIPVFQISRMAAKALYAKKQVWAVLDFIPEKNTEEFLELLKNRIRRHPEKEMDVFFTGMFHKKLADVFLKTAGIKRNKKCGTLSAEEKRSLVLAVKNFRTEIIGTNPFEQAQVAAGGVSTREIDADTMESRLVKGLYFAGELMDVDGICGGYNLHWAWASGYLAGKGAANA